MTLEIILNNIFSRKSKRKKLLKSFATNFETNSSSTFDNFNSGAGF